MKFLKRICSRLNRFLSPQPGKNGSSMAFVMIIGAVLVIWVLAIMPLMVAVGNNSLSLQGSYADYLQSRSAIEFCKGELEKMVESKPPYTFCVVKNGNEYTAIPKMDSITLSDQYDKAINRDPDATDVNDINDNVDTDDVPKNTAEGNSVVAICAVSQDSNADNAYKITITTYNNGKKGLTYSTVYTIRGSLLINPESYLKSQALPLSDFVVVDGKLGANEIWKSNIHSLPFASDDGKTVTNLAEIQENLLPYVGGWLPGDGYADSGVFPAVFKTPVYPAIGGSDGDSDITEDTNVGWIRPKAVKEGKEPGVIYFTHHAEGDEHVNNNIINIYVVIDDNGNEINITDTEMCEIYINGNKHVNYHDDCTIIPEGIYQVSVDFAGTNIEGIRNILPVNGLILGEIGEASTSNTVKQTAPVKTGITVYGTTVTVNSHASNTGVTYGYCAVEDFPEINEIKWNPNSNDASFQIDDSSKAYYFFAYRKAYYENGTYYAASDVTYMGCVYPMETTTQLQDGFDYLIVAKDSSGNYHAMGRNNSNSITQQDIGTLPTLIESTPDYSNNYLWTVKGSNNTFTFQNKGNNKYLSLTGTYTNSWLFWGSWSFSLGLDDGTNNASFTYNGKKLSRFIKSGRQATSGYINFESESFKAGDSGSEIYFVKMPVETPAEPDMSSLQNTDFVKLTEDKIIHGTPLSSVVSGTYETLKANGSNNTDNLNAGKYNVTAVVEGHTVNLGMIEVTKASLSGNLTIEATQVDHTVAVEIKAMNVTNAGAHWIGYKATGSSEYAWFPAYENNGKYTYKFTLPYGDYEFVAYETGSLNYEPVMSDPVPVSLTEPAEEAPGGGEEGGSGDSYSEASMMMGSSLYFMGRDGSIMTEGTTIHLYSDLIVLRHDIKGNGSVMVYPYSDEPNTYDPNDTTPDTLLFAVNDIRNASGNVVFEALTFYRIPAHTDINEITDTEAVNLHPLNINNDIDKLKLLLRSEDYPEINMDIAYIDREQIGEEIGENNERIPIYADRSDDNQLAHIVSGETIGWTVDGVLGNDAEKNTEDTQNRQFVVCAYISSVKNTSINRTANRILIAAAEKTGEDDVKTYPLTIPSNITFTCRYFSMYADEVTRQGTANLTVKNLGKDTSFIESIKSLLNLSMYYSRSLQIDFELGTNLLPAGTYIPAQICRVDEDTWELFGAFKPKPLMVTYTNSELKKGLSTASTSIRIVDRYVSIIADGTPSFEITAAGECSLQVFSNYLYIDDTVTDYKFNTLKTDIEFIDQFIDSLLGYEADFFVNSQESGYKSEYLGFFTKNSIESYSGTIIYIAPKADNKGITIWENTVKPIIEIEKIEDFYGLPIYGPVLKGVEIISENPTEIPAGFYYIPAVEVSGSTYGTSLSVLADLPKDENGNPIYGTIQDTDKVHRINPADLYKYSIYIKPDGTMSNEYVDTGLIGNGDLGESGFSGGNLG